MTLESHTTASANTKESTTPSTLVPPSLLRIRQFLGESGLKVRPWETPEQTMDALRQVLNDNRGCPGFWHALEVLLGSLTDDLARTERLGEQAVQLGVFPSSSRAQLMSELRDALCAEGPHRTLPAGMPFRGLAAQLSSPAVVALCLLAGVALTGCAGRADDGMPAEGSGGSSAGSGGAVGTDGASGGSDSTGGAPSSGGAASGGSDSTGGTGGRLADPSCSQDSGGPDGAAELDTAVIASVLTECNVDSATSEAALNVVDSMNQCWRSGVRSVLDAATCEEVEQHVGRMIDCDFTENGKYSDGEFSLDEFLDYCSVAVYRGVAFE